MDDNTRETMFSSKSDEWSTPQDLYDYLDLKYGPFHLDPCATKESAKCPNYLTIEDDAFSPEHFHPEMAWGHMYDNVFINPPYSDIKRWTEAAYSHGNWNHKSAVLLIPSRTDTKYFHKYCMKAHTIAFIKGRLKFGDNKNSAPFPSMVVIFGNHDGIDYNRSGKPLIELIDYKMVKSSHQEVIQELAKRRNDYRDQIIKIVANGMLTETSMKLCKKLGFTDLLG